MSAIQAHTGSHFFFFVPLSLPACHFPTHAVARSRGQTRLPFSSLPLPSFRSSFLLLPLLHLISSLPSIRLLPLSSSSSFQKDMVQPAIHPDSVSLSHPPALTTYPTAKQSTANSNKAHDRQSISAGAPTLTKLETVLCGSTAGVVSRFVIAPLDVVKIRLQV